MFGIAAAKAEIQEVVAERLGVWKPRLVFLSVVFQVLSQMQIFVLAWGTSFYLVPVYLLFHLTLAIWASVLDKRQILEAPLYWFFPPGTGHLLAPSRYVCFRMLSLGLRLAAAVVPVVFVVVPMARGVKPRFPQPVCSLRHHCEGLPPWLKQPWWDPDATCLVSPEWYNRCFEQLAFGHRGWCNFSAGNCYLRNLPRWLVDDALGPLFFVPLVATLAAVLLELLLCCGEPLAHESAKQAKQVKEEEVTARAKLRFLFVTLLPFLVDLMVDLNGILQFIRTGNLWFAAASTGIFFFSGWQQIRRGAFRRVLHASLDSFQHGKASDEFELILLSEKAVEVPLQLMLQYYSFPFITSSEFAIYSFFLSISLSVKSMAEAAYHLVELNLSATIIDVEHRDLSTPRGMCEDSSESSSEAE